MSRQSDSFRRHDFASYSDRTHLKLHQSKDVDRSNQFRGGGGTHVGLPTHHRTAQRQHRFQCTSDEKLSNCLLIYATSPKFTRVPRDAPVPLTKHSLHLISWRSALHFNGIPCLKRRTQRSCTLKANMRSRRGCLHVKGDFK
jgi:hypothetical protein